MLSEITIKNNKWAILDIHETQTLTFLGDQYLSKYDKMLLS